MKILYSLPHPADRLDEERAGHVVRANAILDALERQGHTIVRIEAAAAQSAKLAVAGYRGVVKRLLPRAIALRLRDAGRVVNSWRFSKRLIAAIENERPDFILETHVSFCLAGVLAAEATGVPLVMDDVSPTWEDEEQYGLGLKGLLHSVFRRVRRGATLMIAVNSSLRAHLIEEGVDAQRLITLENGIDARWFANGGDGERERCKGPRAPIQIGFVGSFQNYHKVPLLIDAFAEASKSADLGLLLVGEGETTAACKALAARLGIENRVTFAGRVPYGEVPEYLHTAEILVMPATNDYGNPMKIYEYMAMAKAIVAPDQPTIREIVEHGRTAYLFPKENRSALSEVLMKLADDPALRRSLGGKAFEAAKAHTWDRRAADLIDAMKDKIAGAEASCGDVR